MALNYLNCDPENAIYVGDHQRDIEAGLNGVKTVCAAYGYTKIRKYTKWNADFTINKSEDLKKLLRYFFLQNLNDIKNYSPANNFLKEKYFSIGASDGIGKVAATTFAKYGATVILLGKKKIN